MPEFADFEDQSQIAAALGGGVRAISQHQEVLFNAYSRVVLPIDGYVFWQPTGEIKVQGALHHAQELQQNEDETLGSAATLFTTQQKVVEFSAAPINTIFVAREGDFRYAFYAQSGYMEAANLWHYQGRVIPPAMTTQLLDNPASIDPKRAIVSNSLPLWLALNGYTSPYVGGFSPGITLYPSFAVSPNLTPPYGAVHIAPEGTRSLQAVPLIKRFQTQAKDNAGNPITSSNGDPVLIPWRVHNQLMADRVRVTLYGLQNDEAMDFLDSVLEFSQNFQYFGLMNAPAVTDGKRAQAELQALAMQKIIEFEVSYNQARVKSVATQLIESAQVSILLNAA